jgi:tRNA (cmo5U34)-methyltransferase
MKTDAGDNITKENANWSFGGKVSKQFDAHVSKSVPLYQEGHDLILKLSDYFLHENSICYDLGCSTGTLLQKISSYSSKKLQLVGIDEEKEMLLESRKKSRNNPNITFTESRLLDYDYEKSDLIISYYTMQFTEQKDRQLIFDKLYKSLNWGGAFIFFEKVRAPDARFQDILTGVYNDYKLDQGYTPTEIFNKTRSLKGVLEPFSVEGNIALLERAGFKDFTSIMQYVNFQGFLAIK